MQEFNRLLEVLRKLRGAEGCAWDKEQTLESFTPFVIAEAKEIEAAVTKKDYEELRGELGDLLYNVLHLAAIAEEAGHFSMNTVMADVTDKMVRRHPHVFGPESERTTDVEKIKRRWEEIKQEERKRKK